jgi:hypothetical protein
MRRWRKMTWVVLLWCAAIIAWAIATGSAASKNCGTLSQDTCNAAGGLGVALVLFIGFFGFVFLALIWFMTRPRTRPCPRCGEDVKKGRMECKKCGFDFTTIGSAEAASAAPVDPA